MQMQMQMCTIQSFNNTGLIYVLKKYKNLD
jgi:hypothetical protein